MRKIKREDEVIVLAGKDKGKQGKIVSLVGDDRVIVSGINMMKKHQKPNPQANVPGGIIEKEAPIQLSNLAILNPTTNKADRVGFKIKSGKKVRIFKSNGENIDA